MRANVLKREEIEARVNEKEFMDDYEAELVSGGTLTINKRY